MASDLGGQIQGISLDSFLQMAQMEKTTGTVRVRTGEDLGFLYLLKGDLIDAETGILAGKDAAVEIISWENSVIEIEDECKKTDNVINEALSNVLAEGMKVREEQRAAGVAPAPPPPPPEPMPTEGYEGEEGEAFEPSGEGALPGEPAPAAPPAKKKPPIKTLALAAVLVVVVGGAFIALGIIPLGGDKGDYEAMMEQLAAQDLPEQINTLRAFIDSHEASEYTQMADKQIKDIQNAIEAGDFDSLLVEIEQLPLDDNYAKAATALYEKHLSKYPNGHLMAEVKKKIAGIPVILDNAEYEKVKAAEKSPFDEKVAVYNTYLKKFPGGQHQEPVRKLLAAMSETFYGKMEKAFNECDTQKVWDKCIELCSNFIEAFKDHPKLEAVIAQKLKMQGQKDVAGLVTLAQEKGNDFEAARAVFSDYLKSHPDTMQAGRIQEELAKIDQKIDERNQWKELEAYGLNKKENIFDRLKKLDEYIKKNPSGPYTGEAKKLVNRLAPEKQAGLIKRQKEAAEAKRQAQIRLEKQRQRQNLARKAKLESQLASQIKGLGNRYRVNRNGTVTDTGTGLSWVILDSFSDLGRCLDHKSAVNYVRGLKTGGYSNWRLPTAGELAGIYKNPPYFPSSVAWYWSSEAYVKGFHRVANVVTTKKETVFKIAQQRQDKCGSVRAVRP